MSIALALISQITVKETIALNVPFADATASKPVVHDLMNETAYLSATSTPPVADHAAFQQALTGGAATINLTALAGTDNRTIPYTGKKVVAAKFRNPATNANAITIKYGASNPYLLLGLGWTIVLNPGQSFMFNPAVTAAGVVQAASTPTIDSTHYNIDLAGTGTQALDCEIVIG